MLCGLYLPSHIIASSPEEFIIAKSGVVYNPINLVVSNILFFSGLCFVWPLCIYKMFSCKVRSVMTSVFFVVFVCSIFNALLLNNNYGNPNIQFNNLNVEEVFVKEKFLILGFCFVFIFSVLLLCVKMVRKRIPVILFVILVVQIFIGGTKINKINRSFVSYKNETFSEVNKVVDDNNNIIPQINLSKTQKNVVVLFIDRAIPSIIPYILKEFPNLKNEFSGFTSYQNCIGFGTSTNVAIPAMLGGYDYTPLEVSKRPGLLGQKHLEAIKLMPRLFADAGYNVTVLDVPYANFKYTSEGFDPQVFDDIEGIKAVNISEDVYAKLKNDFNIRELDYGYYQKCIREFNLMQVFFPGLRSRFYNKGNYYFVKSFKPSDVLAKFPRSNLNGFAELYYLKDLTILDSKKPTFTVLTNMLAHSDGLYKLYGKDYTSLYESDGLKEDAYEFGSEYERTSYHSNACALNLLGKWFEYLKKNGCYDNTRIIVVSDHGYGVNYPPFTRPEFADLPWDSRRTFYNPILIVKDFNATGELKLDYDKFTTNAEVLNHCIKGLGMPNVNPFTGNSFKKDTDYQYFDITVNRQDGPTMAPEVWAGFTNWNVSSFAYGIRVKKSVFDPENWSDYEYDK